MKRFTGLVLGFVFLTMLFCNSSFAVGFTKESLTISPKGQMAELVYTLTAAADGSFPTEVIAPGITGKLKWFYLDMMLVDPGSPSPTPSYDIKIRDDYTVDILGGNGNNLSATEGEQILPKVGSSEGDRLITTGLRIEMTGNNVNSAIVKIVLIFIKGEEAR